MADNQEIHPLTWLEKHLKIITFDGSLVSLRANIAQRKVYSTIYNLQIRNNLPVRAVILKARREGISTLIDGLLFLEVNNKTNRFGSIVSADTDATNKLFRMINTFQDYMPAKIKKETKYSNRKELAYPPPHNSLLLAQTAGKDVLGRGGLLHYLHCSEMAFWNNAKEQFGGIMQEVPDLPDTMVFLESTAFGVGGAFYDNFYAALNNWRETKDPHGWIPIFLPWFIFPDYQLKVPKAIHFEVGRPHDDTIPSDWVVGEDELVEKFKLCPEQLYWRRWAIKNKCQSDLNLFLVEYPATYAEAFRESGRHVFSQSRLDNMWAARQEGKTGLFDVTGKTFLPSRQTKNCWTVFEFPQTDYTYTMGIDCAEHKLSDPNDRHSKTDFNAVQIFCRQTKKFVAEWHGRDNQKDLGHQVLNAAKAYNAALVGPEIPMGMPVLDVLKESGYQNIYLRQIADEQYVGDESENLGWRTTVLTRPKMIQDFVAAVNENTMRIYSAELMKEMRSFVYDKNGFARHRPGEHDDLVFAAMIAYQLFLRTPTRTAIYKGVSLLDPEKGESNKDNINKLARRGAIDDWSPEDSDKEEDLFY